MPDDWPEFQVPDLNLPAGDEPPASPPAPSAGAYPAAPAAGAAPPAPPAGPPGADEMIPKSRLDELTQRYDATARRVQELERIALRALDLKTEPAAAPLDPRTERIRQELLQHFPELKTLLGLVPHADALIGGLQSAQERSRTDEAGWKEYATESLAGVTDLVAPLLLGKGKTGKDLDADQFQDIKGLFASFVGRDPARMRRYDRGDVTLRQEFAQAFARRYLDSQRRGAAADVVRNVRPGQHLPVSGAPSALGTAPPKPADTDEDAIHKRAFAMTQEIMRQG